MTYSKIKKRLESSKKSIDLVSIQQQLERDKVRERTRKEIDVRGRYCEICGSNDNLTRHHKEYRQDCYLFPMKVRVVCRDCHDKLELAKKKINIVL